MSIKSIKIPTKVSVIFTEVVILPGSTKKLAITGEQNLNTLQQHIISSASQELNNLIGVIPATYQEFQTTPDTIGTLAFVSEINTRTIPTTTVQVTLTGICRFKTNETKEKNSLTLPISIIPDLPLKETEESKKYWGIIKLKLPELLGRVSPRFLKLEKGIIPDFPLHFLLDMVADIVAKSFEERVDILNTVDSLERLRKVAELIKKHKVSIADDDELEQKPKLGLSTLFPGPLSLPSHRSTDVKHIKSLKRRIEAADLPEAAHKVALDQLATLERMSTSNPEHYVISSHLELIIDLPWRKSSSKEIDINEAKTSLDKDHFALDKVKKRVLEYLAVRQLKKDNLTGPILCFVGPPGVGKTSVGRSIANILGREFQRICLGGVNSPSEIRGHRRAYIGSGCGRIIQALKNAGTNNPVILLDEIDKMGRSVQGDPTSSLLEVLDPEQNHQFVDHYLSIPFDLSQIIFVATANSLKSVQSALIDRMEIIPVTGYTTEEKSQILKQYLLPKQINSHGLSPDHFTLPDDSIDYIIKRYTRESGVRSAERNVSALCRNVALTLASKPKSELKLPIVLTETDIRKILGREKFLDSSVTDRSSAGVIPGVVIGLAYTTIGGSFLVIEVNKFPNGNGELIMTGQLGQVLSESATVALNWVRANAALYGIVEPGEDVMNGIDLHFHIPQGAVPKDGPSAGITIAIAMLSLFANIPVVPGLALTGEISLQGNVLAVGGLKEKILAASRAGITRVILPKSSEFMMDDIPKEQVEKMEFKFVDHMREVVQYSFDSKIAPKNTTAKL